MFKHLFLILKLIKLTYTITYAQLKCVYNTAFGFKYGFDKIIYDESDK